MNTQNFTLVLDGVPYEVKAIPFQYNNQTRFRVTYNGSGEYIFARDAEIGHLAAIGAEAVNIPDNLEEAIAQKLSPVHA